MCRFEETSATKKTIATDGARMNTDEEIKTRNERKETVTISGFSFLISHFAFHLCKSVPHLWLTLSSPPLLRQWISLIPQRDLPIPSRIVFIQLIHDLIHMPQIHLRLLTRCRIFHRAISPDHFVKVIDASRLQ